MRVKFYALEMNHGTGKPYERIDGVGQILNWNDDFSFALVQHQDKFYRVKRENIVKIAKRKKRKK